MPFTFKTTGILSTTPPVILMLEGQVKAILSSPSFEPYSQDLYFVCSQRVLFFSFAFRQFGVSYKQFQIFRRKASDILLS